MARTEAKTVKATVCPNCKALNELCTIEEVIQVYWFNPETEDFELLRDDEATVLNVYCNKCDSYFDDTNIYDYIAGLTEDGELILGDKLKNLTAEDKDKIKVELQKKLEK